MKHLILTGFLLFSFFGLAESTGVTPTEEIDIEVTTKRTFLPDNIFKKKNSFKEDEQVLSGEGESDDCLTCEYRLAVAKGAMRSELCTYFPYLHNEATGECVEEINTLEKEEQEFLINRAERLSPDELLVVGLAKNSLEREVLESDPDSALAREIINRERLAQMTRMIGMPAMPFANFYYPMGLD